jgi:hypothetical protein
VDHPVGAGEGDLCGAGEGEEVRVDAVGEPRGWESISAVVVFDKGCEGDEIAFESAVGGEPDTWLEGEGRE